MKTLLNLKQCLILLGAIFTMTSCLKSDDPDFQVIGEGYIQQIVVSEGDDENPMVSRFIPIIRAVGYNGTISACSVTSPDNDRISMTQMTGNQYIWVTNTMLYSPSSKLSSGTFTISATTLEGESSTFPVSINNTTEMKTKLEGSIDLEDKNIRATFNKVEGATNYLVVLKQQRSGYADGVLATLASYTTAEMETVNWNVTINEGTYSSRISGLTKGTYYLSIAAAITSSSALLLYQESDAVTAFVQE